MNQVMLNMPPNLHEQLAVLANQNKQSVDQYILKALTQLVAYQMQIIPLTKVMEQEKAFHALRQQLGPVTTPDEARQILQQTHEAVEPEVELTPQLRKQFRKNPVE
ncbi:hypothetical protein QUF63_09415 [Anaerolineales bacterium HSG25]|nr:hypothetical protein [Anaerolineales bacterium HSG25]